MELCADSGLLGNSPVEGLNGNFRSGSATFEFRRLDERMAFCRMKKKQAPTKASRAIRTPTTMPAIVPGARELELSDVVGVVVAVSVTAT